LTHSFPKYVKFAEIAIIHVVGSVEDECCLSSLTFLKSELRAMLDPHLPLAIEMYSYKYFTLETFPCNATFDAWIGVAIYRGFLA